MSVLVIADHDAGNGVLGIGREGRRALEDDVWAEAGGFHLERTGLGAQSQVEVVHRVL